MGAGKPKLYILNNKVLTEILLFRFEAGTRFPSFTRDCLSETAIDINTYCREFDFWYNIIS